MIPLAIGLIAAWPLIARPGLPRHTDLELHVFRAAEFQRLVSDRPLEYPRWAPSFYYGYGYPIFNYYAPLTYTAASAVALIPGLNIVAGVKVVLLLTFLLAAVGTYYFARRHFGSTGGVIASAVYVLSPYILFVDPFMRGDAAEFLALGLLPWLFLAFDRPLNSPRAVGQAALALAAIVFSHNLIALMAVGMLVAWLMWRGLLVDGVGRWPGDLAAIVFAAGLTAVFWLPFLAERGAVRLDVAGPGHFDFRNHFVELGTLLRPSPALDLGATTPHFIYNLGLAQWVFALLALPALRRLSRPASRLTAFFVLAACLLIFLITPASRFLWEAIPPAALIQFPWRFLGPAAFALAMCAAAGLSTLQPTNPLANKLICPVALAVILVSALSTMYPPAWDADFGDTSPAGSIDFELSGVALGTTSTGDFLPVTVSHTPPPAQPVVDSIRAGRADRFDYAGAPGARTTPIHLGDLDAEYAVEPSTGFTARFFVFAFPGWQAVVDGQAVPSRPGGDGFVQFDVPASARSFGLRFESTPPRTLGSVVSVASALLILALLVAPIGAELCPYPRLYRSHGGPPGVGGRMKPATPAKASTPTNTPTPQLSNPLLITLVVFLFLKLAVFDRCDTCFRYTSPPGRALAATNGQEANFGQHIALLGFDLPRPEIQSGDALPLTLYWRATAPVPTNYQVFAHLVRPPFILWGQSDKLNPGDFPTTRWPLDRYVWDDHVIRVLPATPPGDYVVEVGLYTLSDGRRAPVFGANGGVVGDSVQLRLTVHVVRAAQPPPIDSLGMQVRIDRREGDVALLGASIEQASLPRPNFARLTLFWQALADAPADRIVRAQLIDQDGRVANEIATTPTGGVYPPPSWRAKEIVRDVYAFWLPPDFAPGKYLVRVGFGDGAPDVDVGQIEVTQ